MRVLAPILLLLSSGLLAAHPASKDHSKYNNQALADENIRQVLDFLDIDEIARFSVSCRKCTDLVREHFKVWFPLNDDELSAALDRILEKDYAQLLRIMLELKPEIAREGENLLKTSASYGSMGCLYALMQRKPLNETEVELVLTSAAKGGQNDLIKWFLESSVSISDKIIDSCIPIAAEGGHIETIQFLLSQSRENASSSQIHSLTDAYYKAAKNGFVSVLELLESPEMLAMHGFSGVWARREGLVYAAENGQIHCIEFMLSANRKSSPSLIQRAFSAAASSGQLDVLKYFMAVRREFWFSPAHSMNEPFRLAACKGHINVLEFLIRLQKQFKLADHFSVDPADKDNEALICAANNGHLDVIKYLISLRDTGYDGIDPRARDDLALTLADRNGFQEIADYLINL